MICLNYACDHCWLCMIPFQNGSCETRHHYIKQAVAFADVSGEAHDLFEFGLVCFCFIVDASCEMRWTAMWASGVELPFRPLWNSSCSALSCFSIPVYSGCDLLYLVSLTAHAFCVCVLLGFLLISATDEYYINKRSFTVHSTTPW